MDGVNELQKKGTKTMANLPGSIKNLNTLLGEQLLEGGGSGGGGSSDFSTATVTLINETMFGLTLAHIDNTSGIEPEMGRSGEYEVVLYKGKAVGLFTSPSGNLSVTGNITYYGEDGELFITGDGTITIS